MDFNQAMDHLSQQFKTKDWFYEVGQDQFGRIVLYAKYMNKETLHDVPDMVAGVQVLVHFAASKTATRDQFVDSSGKPIIAATEFMQLAHEANKRGIDTGFGQLTHLDEEIISENEEKSLRHLQDELDRLEKICGSYTLQDIFYEVQDGKNAVTNMSARYPEVRGALERLYDMYGFDVIYEELDG